MTYLSLSISLKILKVVHGVAYIQYILKHQVYVFELKYRQFILHSPEEKKIRPLSLGIQNDDETVIKLLFMAFVNIIVKVYYFNTIEHVKII